MVTFSHVLTLIFLCLSCQLATSLQLISGTIDVDNHGTKLFYTDTGAPSNGTYTTIIAVHGLGYDQGVFAKMQSISKEVNVRLVAVNRRDYPGSTPFTQTDLAILNNGTDDQRSQFLKDRGIEFLTFMDIFIQRNRLPGPDALGKNGGVIVVGWSIGNLLAVPAIANIDAVPPATRARLASNIHTFVMHEPSSNVLGLPSSPKNWAPLTLVDPTITPDAQIPFFSQWVASYFQHGNLTTRDPDVLSFIVPGTFRPATVFSMTPEQLNSIVLSDHSPLNDIPYGVFFGPQLLASYQKVVFDNGTRTLLPLMKNFLFGGEHSPAFGPFVVWQVQDDDKAHGGGHIKAKIVPGINHIGVWDEPEVTLEVYLSAFHRNF